MFPSAADVVIFVLMMMFQAPAGADMTQAGATQIMMNTQATQVMAAVLAAGPGGDGRRGTLPARANMVRPHTTARRCLWWAGIYDS
jgi:voltage-gated potassium channel Kch